MITITTTSTQDLAGCLGTVKEQLGVTDSRHDGLLRGLLLVATDRIEQTLGRTLFKQSYQEMVKSYGSNSLLTSQRPIVAVESIYHGTDSGSPVSTGDYWVENANAGEIQRTGVWSWDHRAENRLDIAPIRGQETAKAYTVNYDAGFVYPGTTDEPRTLPHAVEQAAHELAKHFYQNRNVNDNVEMKKVGDLTISYKSEQGSQGSPGTLPPLVEMLLAPYRSIV